MTVRVLFLGEGPSDAGIAAHVERLAWSRGIEAVATSPDLDRLEKPPGHSVSAKLAAVAKMGGQYDVIVVHRDADGAGADNRYLEVRNAVLSSPVAQLPHVAVVPIRMTEAWLLLDEQLIRTVAGNPRGHVNLNLPTIHEAERIRDPKNRLERILVDASELSGRRLQIFRRRFSEHRRQLLERLDPDGSVQRLASWSRFVEDMTKVFDEFGR
ncbi:hypothetical protein [Frankia sp. CiP3]|uniref:hypothetical protein n=1 Tax=Frankia sp. CiP3 TaxID=2880971 RepID=UPI001EF45DD6|nr:hypothetical protein [Frankia sp. CiP3]